MGTDGTPTRPGGGEPSGLADDDLVDWHEPLLAEFAHEKVDQEERRRRNLLVQAWFALVSVVQATYNWMTRQPEPPSPHVIALASPVEPEGGDHWQAEDSGIPPPTTQTSDSGHEHHRPAHHHGAPGEDGLTLM
jgi:hypothetical protein